MSSIQFYWQCPKCDRRMPIEQVVHNCDADGTAVKRAIEYVWYDSLKFDNGYTPFPPEDQSTPDPEPMF